MKKDIIDIKKWDEAYSLFVLEPDEVAEYLEWKSQQRDK